MSYMMYPEMLDDFYFKKVIATGKRVLNVKPYFRKARQQELVILFLLDIEGYRCYDTDCAWMMRHVRKDESVTKELDNWVDTGKLPSWATKLKGQ